MKLNSKILKIKLFYLKYSGIIKKSKGSLDFSSISKSEVNNILTTKIKSLTPELPIVSEESFDNKSNINLNDFWLIDPIDGTYDYINNLEEFTLNAGLILKNQAAAGLIFATGVNAPVLPTCIAIF